MDEQDLFSDFKLEEIQNELGIAPVPDLGNIESSSVKEPCLFKTHW